MKTRVDLKLGDKVYHLVPGPRALMRIAREVGDPVQMAVGLSLGSELGKTPPLATVVEVLGIALAESDYDFGKEDLWELIHEIGVTEVFEPFAAFIAALVNKGVVPEPEAEEAPAENRKARRAKNSRARKSKAKT